jgi:hypothetical protein
MKLTLLLIPLLLFITSCNVEKSSINTLSPDKIQVQEIPNELASSGSIIDF